MLKTKPQQRNENGTPKNDGKRARDGIVGKCEKRFVSREGENFYLPPGQQRELGFTFFFSSEASINCLWYTYQVVQGFFSVSRMVGNDVVVALNEAMERQNLDVRVSALVNDTMGTLARGRYLDEDVMVVVILGT
eukprot:Gb_01790 [translate_table: standard]